MKSFTSLVISSFFLASLASANPPAQGGHQHLHYAAPILITTADGSDVQVTSVTLNGKMAGTSSYSASQFNGYIWDSPTSVPSALPSGIYPQLINKNGSFVTINLQFYDSVSSSPISLPYPQNYDIFPISMNDKDEIVGVFYNDFTGDYSGGYWNGQQAFSFLPPPAGSQGQFAAYINDKHHVLGIELPQGDYFSYGIEWSDPTQAGSYISGPVISDPGYWQIVGGNMQTGDSVAVYRYQNTRLGCGFRDSNSNTIEVIPFVDGAIPTAVSNNGIIIGQQQTSSGVTPLVWASKYATPVDLNTLIPTGTGWTLTRASFILSNGDIVGQGTYMDGATVKSGFFYLQRQ